MSNASEREQLQETLRLADQLQPVPPEGHFTDDEELLTCWQEGLLGPKEHQKIIDHLAICAQCRREVAAMIRAGVVEFAEAEGPAAASPRARDRRFNRRVWAMAAVAAGILVGVVVLWQPWGPMDAAAILDKARGDLAAGNAAAAMDRLEPLLQKDLNAGAAAQAKTLWEEAGYRLAGSSLEAKDFRLVLEFEDRVARQTGPSTRLVNLRLQAERGIPAEFALDRAGSLLDYGYEPDGRSYTMSVRPRDDTAERLDKEYLAVLADYPDDPGILLNRGQFLLSLARHKEARECFAKVVAAEEGNARARIGLGLSAFELEDSAEALRQFEAAARIAPQSVAAHLNAGICLARLGRPAEAVPHWERVLRLSGDADLCHRLQAEMTRIKEKRP